MGDKDNYLLGKGNRKLLELLYKKFNNTSVYKTEVKVVPG
jgi:hypothetical protein